MDVVRLVTLFFSQSQEKISGWTLWIISFDLNVNKIKKHFFFERQERKRWEIYLFGHYNDYLHILENDIKLDIGFNIIIFSSHILSPSHHRTCTGQWSKREVIIKAPSLTVIIKTAFLKIFMVYTFILWPKYVLCCVKQTCFRSLRTLYPPTYNSIVTEFFSKIFNIFFRYRISIRYAFNCLDVP